MARLGTREAGRDAPSRKAPPLRLHLSLAWCCATLLPVASGYTPTSNSAFATAVGAWCSNPTGAQATYGAHIKDWDTSKITSMDKLFKTGMEGGGCASFNDDITQWDVSKVGDMTDMFSGAQLFNQDIGSWDVRQVVTMRRMFEGAKTFNQKIDTVSEGA